MTTPPVFKSTPTISWRARAAWILMTFAAVGVALYFATPYLSFNPKFVRVGLNPAFPWHVIWISAHAISGGLAMLLGPFQFVPALRTRYPKVHRSVGVIYLISVLLGSVLGLISSLISTSGLAAQVGFFLLALAWFYSGLMAYMAVRRHEYELHRIWMIRNYALTFAAVMLRVFLLTGLAYMSSHPAVPYKDAYTTAAWASILVCFVGAEWFIVQRTLGLQIQRKT